MTSLGRLVNSGEAPVARTAFPHVNYRWIVRVGLELRVEARRGPDRGRKRWATGQLWEGQHLVANVEGPFIELRPRATLTASSVSLPS